MRRFSNQPTKKTIRRLFAAEGYLELQLPARAIRELDQIEEAGELSPYLSFLRGQAYRELEQYPQAIDALQHAATTIPAPLNRQVWDDLSDCFRHEGLEELAEIAEMFAADPTGGADWELSEMHVEDFLTDQDSDHEFQDRSIAFQAEDFDAFNFDEDWEDFGTEFEQDSPTTHRDPPLK